MKPNPIIITDDEFNELESNKKSESNAIVLHGDPELAIGSKILVMNESKTKEANAIITGIKTAESIPKDKHQGYRVELTKS